MSNFCEFSSDRINIFLIVVDASGSMAGEEDNVVYGIKRFKKEFDDFHGSGSIAVAISTFDDSYYAGEFKKITEFSFYYHTGGGTALCYSIIQGAKQLMNYVQFVANQTSTIPRATFVVFSDGMPNGDSRTPEEAAKVISELNYAGVTTAFVAFNGGISKKFGEELGFQAVTDSSDMIEFMVQELSNSVKEQSQSMRSLGENFFSKANRGDKSEEYSQTTAQALNDDDWIDEI